MRSGTYIHQKIAMGFCLLLLFSTSCKNAAIDLPKDLDVGMILDLISSMPEIPEPEIAEPEFAEPEIAAWKITYLRAMMLSLAPAYPFISGDGIRGVLLRDINFDGIPELLFTSSTTRTYYFLHGFSYQNGKVIEIPISTLVGEVDFIELYQDKETGEFFWMANGGISFLAAGDNSFREEDIWNKVIFSKDLSEVQEVPVLHWEIFTDSLMGKSEDRYYLIKASGERQPITEKELEKLEKELFSGYVHHPTLLVHAYYQDFISKVNEEKVFNGELFMTLLDKYEVLSQNLDTEDPEEKYYFKFRL